MASNNQPNADVNGTPTAAVTTVAMVPTTTTTITLQPTRVFSAGELVWGPVRGYMDWPGKIVPAPDGAAAPNDATSCWVQWFGKKSNAVLMQCSSLKSLSEGLEAHHKAQQNSRKWEIRHIHSNIQYCSFSRPIFNPPLSTSLHAVCCDQLEMIRLKENNRERPSRIYDRSKQKLGEPYLVLHSLEQNDTKFIGLLFMQGCKDE